MREKQIGLEIKQEVGTVGYGLNRNYGEGGGGGQNPHLWKERAARGIDAPKDNF